MVLDWDCHSSKTSTGIRSEKSIHFSRFCALAKASLFRRRFWLVFHILASEPEFCTPLQVSNY